jgi:hypothetical protein
MNRCEYIGNTFDKSSSSAYRECIQTLTMVREIITEMHSDVDIVHTIAYRILTDKIRGIIMEYWKKDQRYTDSSNGF